MKTPTKWHGGKHYLAKKIIALMPPHTHYVEPYFGGGSVLLSKDPADTSEVVNDINGELMTFWNVLRCPVDFAHLQKLLSVTPFSEGLFDDIGPDISVPSDVGSAWRFFVRCRQSFSGRMKDFAPLTRNRLRNGMNEQASAWLGAIDGLPEVHQRMLRVVVLNDKALNVIRAQDGPNTLFYCDPPYLHSTRATTDEYTFEMTPIDHIELLDTLASIKGKFLLSGYPSEMYDNFALAHDWPRQEFKLPNNSSKTKTKKRMTECVWTNF